MCLTTRWPIDGRNKQDSVYHSTMISIGGAAVIKAQVLAGGRGKGHFDSGLQGGVRLAER